MDFVLLALLNGMLSFFQGNAQTIYFYYDFAALIAMVVGVLLSLGEIGDNLRGVGRGYGLLLIAVVMAFLAAELLLVHPTVRVYTDEYIYMSEAKTMLFDHISAVCSFSTALHCAGGGASTFEEPTGWSALLSVAFSLFGVGFQTAFNLVLLLSLIGIVLVFYISYMLTGNKEVALLSSLLFAFTPVFMSFSRSAIIDIPELTALLASVALIETYLKRRSTVIGFASVAAIAYALTIKVDAITVLAISASFLIPDMLTYNGRAAEKKLGALAAMAFVLALAISPELFFTYSSWSTSYFGALPGQPRFSLYNLLINLPQNVGFFFGQYDGVLPQASYQEYNTIEYPAVYTLFAILGLAVMVYRKRRKEALALALWFAVIFIFYSSYYAGGVLNNMGIDTRYFMNAFPAVAILGSVGIYEGYTALGRTIGAAKKAKGRGASAPESGPSKRQVAALVLVAIILFAPLFDLATIVAEPAQDIYPYNLERASQQFVMENYMLMPQGCSVLTYDQNLWYILNRSSIYAEWFTIQGYRSSLLNLSGGCLYFYYGPQCSLNRGSGANATVRPFCAQILANYTLDRLAEMPYDRFGWNLTFRLYKIESYANGTALFARRQS